MSKKTPVKFLQVPGMMLVASYKMLFVVNAVVLYFAHSLFPQQIVLGTQSMTFFWAMLHSVGILTLANAFAIPFAHLMEEHKGRELTTNEWMIKYFLLNFASIWIITRFSDQFGLGISHWYIAAGLAIVLDIAQGMAMVALEKKRLSQA
jgi:hypothetical protein